jgi:hypothetical protein
MHRGASSLRRVRPSAAVNAHGAPSVFPPLSAEAAVQTDGAAFAPVNQATAALPRVAIEGPFVGQAVSDQPSARTG